MCISKADLESRVQEIRRYKAMAEEAAEIQKALEAKVITYMVENDLTEESPISHKQGQHWTRNGLKKISAVSKSTPK